MLPCICSLHFRVASPASTLPFLTCPVFLLSGKPMWNSFFSSDPGKWGPFTTGSQALQSTNSLGPQLPPEKTCNSLVQYLLVGHSCPELFILKDQRHRASLCPVFPGSLFFENEIFFLFSKKIEIKLTETLYYSFQVYSTVIWYMYILCNDHGNKSN